MTEKEKFVGVNPELFTELKPKDIDNPEWLIEVDGKHIPYKEGARFFNPERGLEYRLGRRADGFVGVIDHEPGGGGAVIVPWVEIDRILYVGLLKQRRVTQSITHDVWNVPRGYLDPGETHFETAKREFREETGFKRPEGRIMRLSGKPINSNSGKQDTSRVWEGAYFYRFEVLPKEITEVTVQVHQDYQDYSTTETKKLYAFNRAVITPVSKMSEKIMGCYFLPYTFAMRVGDLFTRGIVGTLKMELEEQTAKNLLNDDCEWASRVI